MKLRRWTPEETRYLTEALAAGKSAGDIAAALGRTPDAVKATTAYRSQTARHRSWSADEIRYLTRELKSGTPVAVIAAALGRSSHSVSSAANKAGFSTRKLADVPCRIGEYDILCAEVPARDRRVLIRYPCCRQERWYRLASLRYCPPSRCRACNYRFRSPAPPRFRSGDQAGHFTVTGLIGQRNGGWQYHVRDNRCGHVSTAIDRPEQFFLGTATRCGCPARVILDGYVYWAWYMPDGQRVSIGEHRIIMEQILGRPLYPDETVHHRNGIRDDNRPENLEPWSSSHPSGQRVEDKITWATEFLSRYLDSPLIRDPRIVRELLGGIEL